MMTRIKAVRSTFSLALTIFELVIAFHFLSSLINLDGYRFTETIGDVISGKNYQSTLIKNNNLEGQVGFLFVVLVFMIFSTFLFMVVPRVVDKQEKSIQPDYE